MYTLMTKPLRLPKWLFTTLHTALHITCASWLAYIFYLGFSDQLGGDPGQYLLDFTGIGALNLLITSLLVSILAQWLLFGQLMKLRRPLGIYAAVYALAHFFVFIAFELQFEVVMILSEIVKRPYITVGFIAFSILLALMLTSPSFIRKKMGRQWQRLHNFSYVAVVLGGLHYLWLVKSGWLEPTIYLGLAALLLIIKHKKIRKIFK